VLCPLYVGVFIGSREEMPPQGQSFSTVHPKKHMDSRMEISLPLRSNIKRGFILILAISFVINDPYTFHVFQILPIDIWLQSSLIIAPYI
jgi:hypothetical protein